MQARESEMSKLSRRHNTPTKRGDKWSIRWRDENGRKRRETFDDREDAQFALDKNRLRVKEIDRGIRLGVVADRTFDELCDLWRRSTLRLSVLTRISFLL